MDVPIIPILAHYGIDVPDNRREFQILCPVHEERVKSCSVNVEKGLIHCQACGFGGDAITLIMEKEKCEYRAAVSFAESIVGEISRDVPRPTRRSGHGVPGRTRAWKPSFRNTPSWRRPRAPEG